MRQQLQDKVALVTGAGRGVGRADAIALARHGAQVIITNINAEDGAAVAAEIGSQARFVRQDVSSEDDRKSLIELIEVEYKQLNILVNNAAILQLGDIKEETLQG